MLIKCYNFSAQLIGTIGLSNIFDDDFDLAANYFTAHYFANNSLKFYYNFKFYHKLFAMVTVKFMCATTCVVPQTISSGSFLIPPLIINKINSNLSIFTLQCFTLNLQISK